MEQMKQLTQEQSRDIKEVKEIVTNFQGQLDEINSKIGDLQRQNSENVEKMNVLASNTMKEVIRIDGRLDAEATSRERQGKEAAAAAAVHQQSLTTLNDSMTKIIIAFGLDRGPDAADNLRRSMDWVRDTIDTSKSRRAVVEKAALVTIIGGFMTIIVAGVKYYLIVNP